MKSAAQQLAEIIAHELADRGLPVREVANRCGVGVADVDAWHAGNAIPTRAAWHRLHKMCAKRLRIYTDLHSKALEEERANDQGTAIAINALATGRKHLPPFTAVGTNMGDKMRQVLDVNSSVLVAPPPAPAPAKPPAAPPQQPVEPEPAKPKRPPLPPGAKSYEGHLARIEYARSVLVQRPNIPISGPDGLQQLLRTRFRIGVSFEVAQKIVHEARGAKAAPAEPPPAPAPAAAAAPIPPHYLRQRSRRARSTPTISRPR